MTAPEPVGYVWASTRARAVSGMFTTYEAACRRTHWDGPGWQVCAVVPVRIETGKTQA